MRSRTLALGLAGILALALAACIPAEFDASVGDTAPSPTTAEPTSTPAQASSAEPEPGEFDPAFYTRPARMVLGALDHPAGLTEERVALSIHRFCIGERESESERPPEADNAAYPTAVATVANDHGACPSWSRDEPRPTEGVLYEAEGPASMAITMRTSTGTVQGNASFTMRNDQGEEGVYAGNVRNPYLSVQSRSDNNASVTCRITVDGVVVSENTSHGAGSIASCQG